MNNNSPIIVTQSFGVSAKTLWKAITVREEMVQWYFENIPAFKPEVGFETSFNIHHNEKDFFHLWKITKVIPEKLIAYSWCYAKYPGEGEVFFEISESDNGTELTLTAKGMESFPQHIPEFKRESCVEGWNYFIRERLKNFLDG